MNTKSSVQFAVAGRESLPADLRYTGKYGSLIAAAADLDEHKVIHVPKNGGGGAEILRIYAALNYRFSRDVRFADIKIKQRDGQLWIFKQGEE